ncbi:MAG TPA: ABC transporter permease [Longimicrobiales bacterium]|nr:ABC transporter permease [Longimicrobiales bacterium]
MTLLVPERYREGHLGDLEEGFGRRAALDPRAARRWYGRQALRAVGPALRMRARIHRDRRNESGSMETLKQDLRYAVRALRRGPLFAVVATGTLALAIGVNTAIFSLVSVIVFAELPMRDTEAVAVVRAVNPELGLDQEGLSVPDFVDLAERVTSFEEIGALTEDRWVLTGGGEPVRVTGYRISANTLDMWRLPPTLGRSFTREEGLPGAPPVALISHSFWQGRFGGRPDVLGTTLRLDGIEHTVVGVTSPDLEFAQLGWAQVWTPLRQDRSDVVRDRRELFVTGRLAAGATQARATEEVAAIGRALAAEHPEVNAGWGLVSAPALRSLLGGEGKTIMLMLVITVITVVLIACANVANMLLARASVRERELAVRGALGAGRGRLVRQLLTENLVISLVAGALGLGLARLLLAFLVRVSNGQEEILLMAELDGRVMGFTLVVAILAPLVFGGLPAVRATVAPASGALRQARGANGGRSGKRTRNVLAGAQISLALALMVVAGLMTRTVIALQARDGGFVVSDLVTVSLDLPESGYPDGASRIGFFEAVREALSAIPTVEDVEGSSTIPLADYGDLRGLQVQGREEPADRARPPVEVVTVTPGWLELVGMEVLRGRGLEAQDRAETPPVALLSAEVAARHWPGEDPIGRRIRWTEDGPWVEVVGIVPDVGTLAGSGRRPAQAVYVPYAQNPLTAMHVFARTSAEPSALAGPLREGVWSVDADQPVDRIRTVAQAQYDAGAASFALVSLFAIFAVFALAMAAVGIYGVMAYGVSRGRAEIGLRLALGAETGDVRGMVLRQGMAVVAGGVAAGLPIAWGLSRILTGVVYGVSATDPVVFLGVPGVLVLTAAIAILIPAVRATRARPEEVLRAE